MSLKRYKDIAWFIVKYGQSDFLKNMNVDVDLPQQDARPGNARELAEDLGKLGPTFIKLGQILSSQAYFMPPEYIEELSKLQDEAPEMPFEVIEKVFEQELGVTINHAFKEFDKKPLSAASLGQVHRAVLPSGKIVAVKVQRPDISEEILTDIDLLEKFARFSEKHTDWGHKYHVTEIVSNMKATLLKELDYVKEAQNLTQLQKNIMEFDRLVVPSPIADYTTKRVLTMEFLEGIKVTKLSAVVTMDINTDLLAEQLFGAYLKQILIDGFFHMDPHPGNVYINFEKEPKLVIYDLGMVGILPPQLQAHIFEYLLAMSEGKGEECVDVLIQIGKPLDEFDEYSLRLKVSETIAQCKDSTLEQIPIGKIILKIASLAADAGLWLPSQFNTIGKTLLSLDQVGKALAPNFNPNKAIQNQAAELIGKRMKKYGTPTSLYQTLLETTELTSRLPRKLNFLMDRLTRNDYKLKLDFPRSLLDIVQAYEKVANRITMGLILAALVVGAALLMNVETTFRLFGYPGLAIILFLMAAAGSVFLLINIYIRDRKK